MRACWWHWGPPTHLAKRVIYDDTSIKRQWLQSANKHDKVTHYWQDTLLYRVSPTLYPPLENAKRKSIYFTLKFVGLIPPPRVDLTTWAYLGTTWALVWNGCYLGITWALLKLNWALVLGHYLTWGGGGKMTKKGPLFAVKLNRPVRDQYPFL